MQIELPTAPAVTASWRLADVLAALERSRAVEAVVLLGSTAGEPAPWSDVDLLLDLWQGYFRTRALPTRGEKEDIRYLAARDPAWLDLFERCLHETDRPRRVALYARLVEATFGALWPDEATAVTLAEPPAGPEDVRAALAFWNGLFVEPR